MTILFLMIGALVVMAFLTVSGSISSYGRRS
jgi:hypothetical protein